MAKQISISIIGLDGSGKTSLSSSLELSLITRYKKVAKVWMGSESLLMFPLRKFIRIFFKKNKNLKDYANEINNKKKFTHKFRLFTDIYIFLLITDYKIQYHIKLFKNRKNNLLIFDRYFYDVAINVAITLDWSTDRLISFIRKYHFHFRVPQIKIYLNLPPEVSMQRKSDIPDIEYLRSRKKFYEAISKTFGFIELDGKKSIEENSEYVHFHLKSNLAKKNIFYVHSNNDDVGGADLCFYDLISEVNKKSNYIPLVLLSKNTKIVKKYEKERLQIFLGRFYRPQLSRGFLSNILIPIKLTLSFIYFCRVFRIHKPDLVHVNDLYDFVPAIAAKLLKIKVIYHIRMFRKSKIENFFFKKIIDYSSSMSFSVSHSVKNFYFQNSRNLNHFPKVIHDWPRDPKSQLNKDLPDEFNTKKINVVMIGRIEVWKGQHIFLKAIQEINKSLKEEVDFFIIGGLVKGRKNEKYGKMIIELSEKLGVNYLGYKEDIFKWLVNADISVHSSIEPDPFPGTVLESLLSETATIASNGGGVSEMIDMNKNGILFEPGNYKELSHHLELLIQDKQLRDKFSNEGRKKILSILDKNKIFNAIITNYEKTIINNGSNKNYF